MFMALHLSSFGSGSSSRLSDNTVLISSWNLTDYILYVLVFEGHCCAWQYESFLSFLYVLLAPAFLSRDLCNSPSWNISRKSDTFTCSDIV
jgi:hypothetical protein